MTGPAFQTMSVEDYLRSEETSRVKREYVNGFVYPLHAQAGTTEAHDMITGNIFAFLHGAARRAGCSAHTSDMRVTTQDRHSYTNSYNFGLIPEKHRDEASISRVGLFLHSLRSKISLLRSLIFETWYYYYPDVTVTCEPRDPQARFKVAPCLLVEVLSKSTAHNDHNGKYHAYTALPSLQTYLIAEQAEARIYAYQRTENGWVMTPYGPGESVPLPCIAAQLTLDAVYEGMAFQ